MTWTTQKHLANWQGHTLALSSRCWLCKLPEKLDSLLVETSFCGLRPSTCAAFPGFRSRLTFELSFVTTRALETLLFAASHCFATHAAMHLAHGVRLPLRFAKCPPRVYLYKSGFPAPAAISPGNHVDLNAHSRFVASGHEIQQLHVMGPAMPRRLLPRFCHAKPPLDTLLTALPNSTAIANTRGRS